MTFRDDLQGCLPIRTSITHSSGNVSLAWELKQLVSVGFHPPRPMRVNRNDEGELPSIRIESQIFNASPVRIASPR